MIYDTDHDKGDWEHEVKRDKKLDSYKCSYCQNFFARFSCAKTSIFYNGECDCPRCLGYCECEED